MQNRIPEFPQMYLEYMEQTRKQAGLMPLPLGGTSGASGGTGSPPGGFLGMLVQTRIAYDTTEAASATITSGSTSLLDNLNHIRKRIAILEAGGGSSGGSGGISSGSFVGGYGTATQVAVWTSGSILGGYSGFTYDKVTGRLTAPRMTLANSGSSSGGLLLSTTLLYERAGGPNSNTMGLAGSLFTHLNGWFLGGLNLGPEGFGSATEGSTTASSSLAAGITNWITASSSGSNAHARFIASTSGSTGGDPFVQLSNFSKNWVAGIDTSDGSKYKISASTDPGSSTALTLYPTVLNKLGIGSYDLTLDANIEIDPTGAASGNYLGYNGSKWVPTSGSTTSGSSTGIPLVGWVDATETWTYVSADGPTGIFSVASDVTGKYSIGMRVRYTQTTSKYGIITNVGAFSAGVTQITIYGGTDYTLANAAITVPFYSVVKKPFGFPASPDKWTVTLTDTSDRTQASPTTNTVYNLGSLSISIPIGSWYVDFQILLDHDRPAGTPQLGKCGLSTANNSFSDQELVGGSWAVDSGTPRSISQVNRSKIITVASKTAYYLVASVNTNGSDVDFRGDLATTVARAICAYL